jgi:small basic protein (TIGR04137 family)
MSLHRSLKAQPSALNQHRNVLRRAERIGRLTERDRFDPEKDSPLGLPKVANRRIGTGKKKKAAKAETPAGEAAPAEEKPAAK